MTTHRRVLKTVTAYRIARTSVFAAMMLSMMPLVALGEGSTLDEIVVTARKVEERLQEVPLSISTLSAAQMQERSVRNTTDIAALTPGLNFETYTGGFGTPVIRGAAQTRITDLDQNVSSFFDGIYLPRQYLVNPGVVGLERVEVVKGPQSALYGRNAFMGAINYVTRKPNEDLAASADIVLGDGERRDAMAEVSGALVPGRLFARLSGGYSEYDGDIDNAHPNAGRGIDPGSPDQLGGWENWALQARLVWKPSDTWEVDLGFNRFDSFIESVAQVSLTRSSGDLNCSPTVLPGQFPPGIPANSLYCGELPTRFTPLPGSPSPAAEAFVDPRGFGLDMRSSLSRARVQWRAGERLAAIYEFGYVDGETISAGVGDRDPLVGSFNFLNPMAGFGNLTQATPIGQVLLRSHELRVEFANKGGVSGLIGFSQSTVEDNDRFLLGYLPIAGVAPVDVDTLAPFARGRQEVDTRAAFGRISVTTLEERLRFSAELRYSKEEKDVSSGPTLFVPAVRTLSGSWSQTTPRVTVDFKWTDARLLYLTAAKGAKAGGINIGAIVASQFTYEPDENWTYEFGSKNTYLDGRLRLNGAVFHIDWKNQQIDCSALGTPPGITAPAVICNAGSATITGFEADVAWAITDAFSLTAGLSYNDATFDDAATSDRATVFNQCNPSVCRFDAANRVLIGDNDLPRQSKLQGVLGARFEFPISATLQGFALADVSYKSKQYTDELNLSRVPDRTLLDLRVGVLAEQWEVSIWAKNLTDETYAASAFFIGSAADTGYTSILGPRRQIGLSARYRL